MPQASVKAPKVTTRDYEGSDAGRAGRSCAAAHLESASTRPDMVCVDASMSTPMPKAPAVADVTGPIVATRGGRSESSFESR